MSGSASSTISTALILVGGGEFASYGVGARARTQIGIKSEGRSRLNWTNIWRADRVIETGNAFRKIHFREKYTFFLNKDTVYKDVRLKNSQYLRTL